MSSSVGPIGILVALLAGLIYAVVALWYGRAATPPKLIEGVEGWSPPPELTIPTPRPVRLTLRGILPRVCGAIFFLGFCLMVLFGFGATPFRTLWGALQDPVFFLLVVAILVAVGVLIGVVFFKPSHEQKLLKWGKPARAVITEVRRLPIRSAASYSVTFEFLDDARNPAKGSSDWFLSETPKSGDVQTVLYDPDNPRRSTLYPARSYKIAEPKLP